MKRPPMPQLPLVLTFDRLTESQNESTYAHWSTYSKDKRNWQLRSMVAMLKIAGLNLWWSRWSIVREYAHPHRELDWANLVGGAKPLIDCLVNQQVIKDDRPKHFLCGYNQRKADESRTILTLEEYREEETQEAAP